jgi:hypothetical protein
MHDTLLRSFSGLDAQVSNLGSTAVRIGNRLQVTELVATPRRALSVTPSSCAAHRHKCLSHAHYMLVVLASRVALVSGSCLACSAPANMMQRGCRTHSTLPQAHRFEPWPHRRQRNRGSARSWPSRGSGSSVSSASAVQSTASCRRCLRSSAPTAPWPRRRPWPKRCWRYASLANVPNQ